MVGPLTIRDVRREGAGCDGIRVEGLVDASIAAPFAAALARDVRTLAAGAETVHLDFAELVLDDGAAVAEAVNALREIGQHARVVVRHAPHMLAHTLYKTGMLRSDRFALDSPQEEEPYG